MDAVERGPHQVVRETGQPELLAARRSRVRHTVGVEEHAVASLEVFGCDLPDLTAESHRERWSALQLAREAPAADEQRKRVTGVQPRELAGGEFEVAELAGDEARIVELRCEDLAGGRVGGLERVTFSASIAQRVDGEHRLQHRGHPVAHGIHDGELGVAGVQREVEGVAADRVRGLEHPADRDLVGHARQRRQQIPLDLGGYRQRLVSSAAEQQVGVAPFAEHDQGQHLHRRLQRREHLGIPGGELHLHDADALAVLGQRHPQRGRSRPGHHDLAVA